VRLSAKSYALRAPRAALHAPVDSLTVWVLAFPLLLQSREPTAMGERLGGQYAVLVVRLGRVPPDRSGQGESDEQGKADDHGTHDGRRYGQHSGVPLNRW
jgi:hypothetical protein